MVGSDEKQCPRCAETIKRDAEICRFCRFEFVNNPFFERRTQWRMNGCSSLVVIAVVLAIIYAVAA